MRNWGSAVRQWTSRVSAALGRRDREMDEELTAHLAMAEEEHRRRGMSPEEARQAALREFGGVTQVRETMRLGEGLPFLENLRRDFGYALRQMRKSPGFAATVIGTLALGIGAAAAMFTVVDHVLLQPAPYRDAGRLVAISEVNPSQPGGRSGRCRGWTLSNGGNRAGPSSKLPIPEEGWTAGISWCITERPWR